MAAIGMYGKRLIPVLAVASTLTVGAPAVADTASAVALERPGTSVLGSYLAGRVARGVRDSSRAANYYGHALERDPDNPVLLDNTFALEAASGNWPRAIELARAVVEQDGAHRMARYALAVEAFVADDYEAAEEHLSVARGSPISDLTTLLARAWIKMAQDKVDDAFVLLDEIGEADWSTYYRQFHTGLIADLAARREIAEKAFAPAFERNPRTLRMAEAYARHAVRAGDGARAVEILERHVSETAGHPLSLALLDDIRDGAEPGLLVRDARTGMAEVFYGIGDALASEGGVDMGTVYLQLALHLDPDFELANMQLGEVYEASNRHKLAIEAFARIPEASPLWSNIQVRKAFSLNALERVDEASALLESLAKQLPDSIRPLEALGNILRSRERYEEAADIYGRAIDLIDAPSREHWSLYYSRGVCFERMKKWELAEPDFETSLQLDPDQPLTLNYLGYSWIDQGIHLSKAMDLIRKAVQLKPDDGYFIDSLGWAYYRKGDFQTATKHLERAAELRPEDPVINDHLGDAFWRVGRELEARYQWGYALTLDPEPEEAEKIKQKLAEGLEPARRQAKADEASASNRGRAD